MTTHERIRVHIDYRDSLVAAGLAATLGSQSDFQLVCGRAMAGVPVSRQASDAAPAVIVADYESALCSLAKDRRAGIVILSDRHSESEIRHALDQGALGYLALGCALSDLFDAVRAVRNGQRYLHTQAQRQLSDSGARQALTERELDVLRLLVEGDGNKCIAKKLHVAPNTVKSHAKSIFKKLGAANRTEVAALAARRGLLKLPPAAWQPGSLMIFSPTGG